MAKSLNDYLVQLYLGAPNALEDAWARFIRRSEKGGE